MAAKNPYPWPSISNASIWYAEKCSYRLEQLTVVVTLIQRWWRQRDLPRERQRLYPINMGKIPGASVHKCCAALIKANQLGDGELQKHVYAYEKLDGTNVGVACDGAVFGRRMRIETSTYQHVSLDCLPSAETVQRVKASISNKIDSPIDMSMVVYGELMCNPGRYEYQERSMGKSWLFFGLIFSPPHDENNNESVQIGEELSAKLRQHGFLVALNKEKGRVRVHLNPLLVSLIETEESLQSAPFVDQGTLREIFFGQKEMLMSNTREGLVINGPGTLLKWKSGKEDESAGAEKLEEVLSMPIPLLESLGVDIELAQCLLEVARNKPPPTKKQMAKLAKRVEKRQPVPLLFEASQLERAWESALTKYDALEVYFERNETKMIKNALIAEVASDLNAQSKDELAFVQYAVSKKLGKAYGAWKRRVKN